MERFLRAGFNIVRLGGFAEAKGHHKSPAQLSRNRLLGQKIKGVQFPPDNARAFVCVPQKCQRVISIKGSGCRSGTLVIRQLHLSGRF